jgi:glycosyltransferase involved in cell wall biosynthesis
VSPPLRVCIDSRLGSGISGGVEQVAIGLATGLSKLTDADEEYLFLVHPDQEAWLRPYLDGPCRPIHSRMEYPGQGGLGPTARQAMRQRMPLSKRRELLRSDGTIEGEGVDVVHFPMQEAFLTDVPSIYQPHDLQHLHLPDLFTSRERARRELVYRTHCERASLVAMMTSWGRRDLIEHYGINPEKVAVVTWGSVIDEYPAPTEADLGRVRSELGLPDAFLIYPAQTWPHKNHGRLLEALAAVRDAQGIEIPLVCPGRKNDGFQRVADRIRELGLEGQTWFPGFVGPVELRSLYALARALIFPSKFEGWGMPVTEAFASGLPVGCSSAKGLPDVVGDAGLIFDPDSAAEIGDCAVRLWTDEALRADLVERGRRRAEEFSIDRSVRLFRAHYRRVGGRRASEEDLILLRDPPLA